MMKTKLWKDAPLYFVAIFGSLSEAASIMTLLALSSSFLRVSPDGFASSAIQSMYYLGVGCIGFLGGGILQKWSFVKVGMIGPIVSAVIVFLLACFDNVSPFIGLPSVFFIFLLTGIAHPNSLRFFNQFLPEHKKLSFFSLREGVTAILTIASPVFASIFIAKYGTKTCFIIDGFTYLLSCLPWFLFRKNAVQSNHQEVKWLIGFQELIRNRAVRALTLSRLLNNIAYVFCTTAIPLIIARLAHGNNDVFAFQQGSASSLLSFGFIAASIIGTKIAKKNNVMIPMVYLASALGLMAGILLIVSTVFLPLLYFSAVVLGIGTYCFRLSGMTLGQSFTPAPILGPVIVAGDTVVRIWSFFISLITLGLFEYCNFLNISFTPLIGLVLLFPSICLIAPVWTRQLAKQFVYKNSSVLKEQHPAEE